MSSSFAPEILAQTPESKVNSIGISSSSRTPAHAQVHDQEQSSALQDNDHISSSLSSEVIAQINENLIKQLQFTELPDFNTLNPYSGGRFLHPLPDSSSLHSPSPTDQTFKVEHKQPPPFVVKEMSYREMHRSSSLSRLSRSSSFSEMVQNSPSPPRPLSRSYSFRDPLPSELHEPSEPSEPPERPSSAPFGDSRSGVMQWMDSDEYLQGWSTGYVSRPPSPPSFPNEESCLMSAAAGISPHLYI